MTPGHVYIWDGECWVQTPGEGRLNYYPKWDPNENPHVGDIREAVPAGSNG